MEYLLLLVAGAASGLVAGLTGLGGGTVIVPMLVWLYGRAALHDAIVVSWFAVLFNSASAVLQQYRLRNPEERAQIVTTSKYFLGGVLVVTPIVALVMSDLKLVTPAMVGSLQLTLAAAIMWPRKEMAAPRVMPKRWDTGFGALVGACSTAIGIGGGAYTTAYMLYGPRRALRDAIAAGNITGLAVGTLSVFGFLLSLLMGDGAAASPVSGWGLVLMVTAGLVFSTVGVKLSYALPTATLRKVLVGVLAVSAIRLLVS